MKYGVVLNNTYTNTNSAFRSQKSGRDKEKIKLKTDSS